MTDRLIPQNEWEAQERYLRYQSHADEAFLHCDIGRGRRWEDRADVAYAEWQSLIKERESHA